jgi:hypothetical protein
MLLLHAGNLASLCRPLFFVIWFPEHEIIKVKRYVSVETSVYMFYYNILEHDEYICRTDVCIIALS